MEKTLSQILKELKVLNKSITDIEDAQSQIRDKLTQVAMEQISQRESQYRLERRIINYVKTKGERVSGQG